VKVGDEVVVHCGMWEPDDPWVVAGKDPMFAPTQRIWGYESNWAASRNTRRSRIISACPSHPT